MGDARQISTHARGRPHAAGTNAAGAVGGGNARRQRVQGREQPLMSHVLMLDTKLLRRKKPPMSK